MAAFHSTSIQSLPIEVIHLIAAGEVIDSLAAVVRELVENAIDAQSTRISVLVDPAQWTIRVLDNGQGMTLNDMQQAALPHSTSKIQTCHDLWKITSLGFRGEALHSLAQLSNLEICSRSDKAEAGWQVTYNHHGQSCHQRTIAMAPGTIVIVRDLFSPWPMRRRLLPTLAQQLRQVRRILYHFALCHPHITWQSEQQVRQRDDIVKRPWFSIYPGNSAKAILPQLVRTIHSTDLCENTFTANVTPHQLPSLSPKMLGNQPLTPTPQMSSTFYLLLGLPDRCHRHRPDWITIAINGRVVRLPELEQIVIGAFRRTLPRDRHPVCFVHFHLPPGTIDWNRHPAKLEVYLEHLEHWRKQLSDAIAQTLSLSLTTNDSFYSKRVTQLVKAAENSASYNIDQFHHHPNSKPQTSPSVSSSSPAPSFTSTSTSASLSPSPSTPLLPLKAIAQVHSMYILAEHPAGLWLVEQHIAHERVLYEQLCDRWQVVELSTPIILKQLSAAQVEQLQRLTLTVDIFGENLWAVRTVPQALVGRQDCPAALLELSLGGNLDEAIVATACRTAIRNGTSLTVPDMQQLLDDWQRTHHPHTCPHGRPIYLVLEETQLSRFFRRHWVVGKSHGI